MLCQNCHKNAATNHVTDILDPADLGVPGGEKAGKPGADGEASPVDEVQADAGAVEPPAGASPYVIHEEHLCDLCAKARELPHQPPQTPNVHNILKLLHVSTLRSQQQREQLVCPDCGMTWEEFRRRGRMGCPKDYSVFEKPLADILERMHGATEHVGRLPGSDPKELELRQRMLELKRDLESAIRDEAYESAAKIRDELRQLETDPPL